MVNKKKLLVYLSKRIGDLDIDSDDFDRLGVEDDGGGNPYTQLRLALIGLAQDLPTQGDL